VLVTERMVPVRDETVQVIDRVVASRSAGRWQCHPRTGKLVEVLPTHPMS